MLKDSIRKLLALAIKPRIPLQPLAYLPDGFSVHKVGKTGLSVIENFCTPEEAQYLIDKATRQLKRSVVKRKNRSNETAVSDWRTSSSAKVMNRDDLDPNLMPLLYRAAMLLGVKPNYAEPVYVSLYREGEYYKSHTDFGVAKHPALDRIYTVLIYLNDLGDDEGGGTHFPYLDVEVRPKLGRAVCWTNTNPDFSYHPEVEHAALPVKGSATEKWIVQLWLRNYSRLGGDIHAPENPPQSRRGEPLSESQLAPPGTIRNTEKQEK